MTATRPMSWPSVARRRPASGAGSSIAVARRARRRLSGLLLPMLAGCAIAVPDPSPPAMPVGQWQARLPHDGDAGSIATWWRRLDDPQLAMLVERAQQDAPVLAAALARIEQARAQARAAGALLAPTVDAQASASRSKQLQPTPGVGTMAGVGLDAAWEIDLFGANRRTREVAVARAEARLLDWHDARISLAAEVVNAYTGLRLCEATVALLQQDLASLQRTLALTREKVRTGFTAPADAALIQARLSEARARLRGQQADCDLQVKGLVALSAAPEPALRAELGKRTGRLPVVATMAVEAVPAARLSQRPDIAARERELFAASAEVGIAEADRYPRLRLLGSIGYTRFDAFGLSGGAATWSFGPGLVLPLLDGGRRRAVADGARARYDEAVANYRARTLVAVQEVEQALVRVSAANDRQQDVADALAAYRDWLKAANSRYEAGAGSLLELEDARRSLLTAGIAREQVSAERLLGWLALYKALGGGWSEEAR